MSQSHWNGILKLFWPHIRGSVITPYPRPPPFPGVTVRSVSLLSWVPPVLQALNFFLFHQGSAVSWQMDIHQLRQPRQSEVWTVSWWQWNQASRRQYCYPIYQYPMSFLFSDQHLHDPPVQLWEWPFGTVHFWEPGQVCAVLDQPSIANIAPCSTCKKVLWNLSPGEESLVAGEKAALTAPSGFPRGMSHI